MDQKRTKKDWSPPKKTRTLTTETITIILNNLYLTHLEPNLLSI